VGTLLSDGKDDAEEEEEEEEVHVATVVLQPTVVDSPVVAATPVAITSPTRPSQSDFIPVATAMAIVSPMPQK